MRWLVVLGVGICWATPKDSGRAHGMIAVTQLGQWKDHRGRSLAFSTDGRRFAADDLGTVALFSEKGFERTLEAGVAAPDVAWSSDGKQIYAGAKSYDATSGSPVDTGDMTAAMMTGLSLPKIHYAPARGLVTPDGKEALLSVRFVPSKRLGASDPPNAPAGRLLLLAARSFAVEALLDEQQPFELLAADAHQLAALGDRTIHVFDRQTRKPVAQLKGPLGRIEALRFSPDGKHLAAISSGRDHEVMLWDTATWKVRTWSGDATAVRALAFHPSQPWLFTAGADQKIKLWSLEGKLLQSLDGGRGLSGIAVAADRILVSGDQGLTLYSFK